MKKLFLCVLVLSMFSFLGCNQADKKTDSNKPVVNKPVEAKKSTANITVPKGFFVDSKKPSIEAPKAPIPASVPVKPSKVLGKTKTVLVGLLATVLAWFLVELVGRLILKRVSKIWISVAASLISVSVIIAWLKLSLSYEQTLLAWGAVMISCQLFHDKVGVLILKAYDVVKGLVKKLWSDLRGK
jgi:hypothetical protein